MKVFTDLDALTRAREGLGDGTLGLVPTMGALHQGHLALIRRSAADNAHTMVSVYVNGPQFNQAQDLKNYPRSLKVDVALAAEAGADFVFAPTDADIYPDGYHYRVQETSRSRGLEGQHRPGHFDGVLTVVLKLFLLARPDRAYFGEKDYQQYLLVKGLVESFCPADRGHPDGDDSSVRWSRPELEEYPAFARGTQVRTGVSAPVGRDGSVP